MAKNTFFTLCAFFTVYAIAQGIMDAYEEALEQPYLEHYGIDLELVGIAQTVDFLPWTVKFLWAIPSDAYDFLGFGHRRPYVVLGLVLAATAYAALTLFNPNRYLGLYMLCMCLRNIGIAVADCAVDGLSVDCEMDTEAGAISGWMSLGRTAGTVLACMAANTIAKTSYTMAILASAAFVFIPIPANLFVKEEWVDEKAYEDKIEDAAESVALKTIAKQEKEKLLSHEMDAPTVSRAGVPMPKQLEGTPVLPGKLGGGEGSSADGGGGIREENVEASKKTLKRRQSFVAKVATSVGFDWEMLKELLSQRHVWTFLVYIALATLGLAVSNFALTAWAHEIVGEDNIDVVGYMMSVMSVGCFLASLPMGYLFDYIPSKRVLMFAAAALMGLSNLSLVFCKTPAQVYLGLFGFGAAHGVIYVVQCSMARILADIRIAAAFFGIVNSTSNLMHALGTAIGGPIAERIDPTQKYLANFWIGAIIDFLAVLFVFLMPEKGLTMTREDTVAKRWKILPHRMQMKKVEMRRTSLNTTFAAMVAAGEGGADGSKSPKTMSRRPSFALTTVALAAAEGGAGATTNTKQAQLAVINAIAAADRNAEYTSNTDANGAPVFTQKEDVTRFLSTLPSYVPVAHLDLPTKQAAENPNLMRAVYQQQNYSINDNYYNNNSSSNNKKSLPRRPSMRETISGMMSLDGVEVEEQLRAPRPSCLNAGSDGTSPSSSSSAGGKSKFTLSNLFGAGPALVTSSSDASLMPGEMSSSGSSSSSPAAARPHRRSSVAAAVAENALRAVPTAVITTGIASPSSSSSVSSTSATMMVGAPAYRKVANPLAGFNTTTTTTTTTTNAAVVVSPNPLQTAAAAATAATDRRARLAAMQSGASSTGSR